MAVAGMALKAGYPRRQGPDVNPQRKTSDGVQHLLLNDQFSQFRVQFLLTTAAVLAREFFPRQCHPLSGFASRPFRAPGRQIRKECIFAPAGQALLRKNAPRDVHAAAADYNQGEVSP